MNRGTLEGQGQGAAFRQEYLGRNTIGASYETWGTNKVLLKKISLHAPALLVSVDLYIKDSGSLQVGSLSTVVLRDTAGNPDILLGIGAGVDTGDTFITNTVPRWLAVPTTMWLTPGDYHVGFQPHDSTSMQIAYDAAGADRTYTSSGTWRADASIFTVTSTGNNYSIRASILR